MTAEERTIVDCAIDWHLRHPDMSGEEWHLFLAWMEEDPAHAQAFNALMLDESLLGMRDAALNSGPVRPPVSAPRRRFVWGGVAASGLAAAFAFAFVQPPGGGGPDYYMLSTAKGSHRQVTMDDGTRIDMAGGTRIRFDREDNRFAELVEGEARFSVHHNEDRPFALKVGDVQLRDLGTVFNVQHDDRRMDVQVGEGAVMFEASGRHVKLDAGKALSYAGRSGIARTRRVDPGEVGKWREGRLHFIDTPLPVMARSLERHLGTTLSVDPALAHMTFTGLISLTGDREADIAHVARLAGLTLLRSRKGWTLAAGAHDPV
ncbi:FecR domain-containing protein [Sphingobium sp.]|uniref:FecR family protein n=1 Tax=Sphingobium sp. TaxID=1912891 RepID=UPI0025DD60CC|nr:FecR domain-containing protein [Sphingobium sp.]